MELNKNLIVAMLATGISANTFAANDSNNPEAVETRRDTLKLSEIVVVGYGKMRRKDITSSITTIQSSDLNQGVYTSPAQLLQGKVPGLTVSTPMLLQASHCVARLPCAPVQPWSLTI